MMQAPAPIPADAVRAALAEVLARSELHERESLLEQLIERFAPRLGTGTIDFLGDVLAVLFTVAFVVMVVAVFRRSWAAFRAPRPGEERAEELPDARTRARALAAAGRAARAAGDLRLALRLFFQGLLVALGGRGALELNAAWTNRELLRRGKSSREARALLEPLVRELEPKEFGRAPVDAADVARIEALLAPHLEGGR